MKRVVDIAQLDEPQYKELVGLLRQERIPFHETQTHFMDNGAIWVAEEHFSRVTQILRAESTVYAARAKAKWERQWRTEYQNSFVRWFTHKLFRSPVGTVVRIALLIGMVAAFVVYPLWHVARAAI